MSEPQPYQVNQDGYGQPIYEAFGPGPDVVMAQHVSEYGSQVYLVMEPQPGARPVWFVNGPPPGSVRAVQEETLRQQQQYAAWAASQRKQQVLAAEPEQVPATLLLLLFS